MKNAMAIIDFSSSEIVTLVGEMGVNDTLIIYGKGRVSYAGFQNSEFLEPENLKDAIKSSIAGAESAMGGKITEIFVGVPGEFTAVIPKTVSLTFPRAKRITDFDLESIFRTGNTFEKEINYCTINKSVIYYELDDGNRVIDPIDMKSRNLVGNVSYVLALSSFVNQIKEIFSKLRITIRGFISSVLAQCLYLLDDEERDKYAIMIDVGYISTSVAITQGNGLLFLSSFSLGGGYVSSDLSQCLRIPFKEAEELKNKVVIAWEPLQTDKYYVSYKGTLHSYSAKATNEIALDRIENICDYILRCLNASGFELPYFIPVYLVGDGLYKIKGIKNIISQKLKRQVFFAERANYHKVKPTDDSSQSLLGFVVNNNELLDKIIIKY